METIDKFNIRVYVLLLHQGKILIIKEPYAGEILFKLPGGGLEFGEGILDCLHRELQEELNLKITDYQHFYTQEGFVQSKFRKNEQLITVYYTAAVENINDLQIHDPQIEELLWISLEDLKPDMVTLPVDQLVINLLISQLPQD